MLLSCADAATAVKAGKLIAYPTEAIYGLGCDPRNQEALAHLLKLKSRASDKGLIVIASNTTQLDPFIDKQNPALLERASDSWPGPVTWIMPIAVRVSAHPVVRELCDQCGHALVSTSANISGELPLADADAITEAFASSIAGVVKGALGGLASATSIFDATTGVQLR